MSEFKLTVVGEPVNTLLTSYERDLIRASLVKEIERIESDIKSEEFDSEEDQEFLSTLLKETTDLLNKLTI